MTLTTSPKFRGSAPTSGPIKKTEKAGKMDTNPHQNTNQAAQINPGTDKQPKLTQIHQKSIKNQRKVILAKIKSGNFLMKSKKEETSGTKSKSKKSQKKATDSTTEDFTPDTNSEYSYTSETK